MKILEVRPEQVICEVNGTITTRPNSPYYSLRYFHYEGRQIGYIFNDKSYVRETFDDRIFNCWHDGKRLQLRQDLSEKLAAAIGHHREFDNIGSYEELFQQAYDEQPDWPMLDIYLRNVEGVEWTKGGYIIYDSFKIDFKGNAWVAHQDGDRSHGHVFADEKVESQKGWNSLCIVMQGSGHSYKTEEGHLPDEFGNIVPVSSITMTILTKILFLLNPNLEDTSFTGQLSKSLLLTLTKLTGMSEVKE